MAIVTGLTAPLIGKFSDRMPPRVLPTVGFTLFSATIFGFAVLMTPDSPIVLFLLIAGIAGLSNSCIWAPLASTATHNLPIHQAGAGAGIYNTTRQVGSVLGSAAIGALISSRMAAQGLGEVQAGEGGGAAMGAGLPEQIAEKFSIVLTSRCSCPPRS